MGVVYVPQQPAKWDAATQIWVPKVNIQPAARWGEIRVMFDQSVSRAMTEDLAAGLRTRMRDFCSDDWVCAVGDPALLAMASCIAVGKAGGWLRLLKWDRQAHEYIPVEVRP